MRISSKLRLGFGIQVLLIFTIGLFTLKAMSIVQEEFIAVMVEDSPILDKNRHLSKLVVDMETGQRGFCITLEESFLKPYTVAKEDIQINIDDLMGLYRLRGENIKEMASLERIKSLILPFDQL